MNQNQNIGYASDWANFVPFGQFLTFGFLCIAKVAKIISLLVHTVEQHLLERLLLAGCPDHQYRFNYLLYGLI
jgi:hypothetical protein